MSTVSARPTGENTGAVRADLTTELDALKLPAGDTVEIDGLS